LLVFRPKSWGPVSPGPYGCCAYAHVCRKREHAPVICTVAVGGRSINVIANKPAEPRVSTQCKAFTSSLTGVPTVGVQVSHDEDVVGVPESLHSRVDVHQCFHLFHHRVWVYMNAYQHQLRFICNSGQYPLQNLVHVVLL